MRLTLPTCVLAASLAAATASAATVSGRVSDTTGGVLSGATVVLRGVATGEERTVDTAEDGRFSVETATRAPISSSLRRAAAPMPHERSPSRARTRH